MHSVTSKPFGLTPALSVAPVGASELAGSVLTVALTGVLVVLKVSSAPSAVPPAFLATRWEGQTAELQSRLNVVWTPPFVVPEPGVGVQASVLVYLFLHDALPIYSVTSKPFGLTPALSVAPVGASELAGSVLTVALTGVLVVLKVSSAPSAVPPAFLAT